MLPQDSLRYGKEGNLIREIAGYAAARAAEIGAENVFNFSIGNPNVAAPDVVAQTLRRLLDTMPSVELHAYTPAPGVYAVRQAIVEHLRAQFGVDCSADDLYMTAGASSALTIACKALLLPGDEVIVFAPYFPEYTVYAETYGGVPVILKCREPDFQIDMAQLEAAITEKTKLVIVNSPNNPSGSILSEETIQAMAELLRRKQAEYGHEIYILADEPYRALVYDADTVVPFIPKYYDNTIFCYSYSKCLSIPGERMGYILVPPQVENNRDVYAAVCGAGRLLGYINNTSLFQYMLPACLDATADLSVYKTNRDLLCSALTQYGYEMARPDGAFYLFVKSLEPDAVAFCEKAKEFELVFVPGDCFGYPGYVRISYCVATETIEKSLPAFEALAKAYGK